MRRLLLLPLAALALVAGSADAGRFTLGGSVVGVLDGDTIDVRLSSGKVERVRLIGIDTPERGACGYTRAKVHARRLAHGRRVTLQGDATQATRDRYGRLLAYVWIGRRDLGLEQLRAGNAVVYVFRDRFQRLGLYRSAERGLRGCGTAAPAPAAGACDPSYPDYCIPPPPPDLDCADMARKPFRVVGSDPHRFDRDGDGLGCE